MSRSLAVLVAGIAAVVMVLSKFIVPMESAETTVAEWFNAMAAIAFVLGGASLLKMNLLAISARGPGWGYAAVTLVTFLVTLGVGLLKVGVPPSPAFPGHPMGGSPDGEGGALAGDIVLCAPVIRREARAQGKPLLAHYAHLTVHGLLHLQGYGHGNARDARAMEAMEKAIMRALGYPDPYESGAAPEAGAGRRPRALRH